jgi:hypothetical protein
MVKRVDVIVRRIEPNWNVMLRDFAAPRCQ